jgi:mercuric ion transport protein
VISVFMPRDVEGAGMNPDRQFKVSLAGMAVAALCCFTPALVVLFGLLGISAAIGYADYVLLPALAGFAVMAVMAWRRRRMECSRPKA